MSEAHYGYHASIDRGYLSAVEKSISLGADAVQMWMGNSKGYASKVLPPATFEPVAKLVKENNMFLIAHSPYILNFARPLQESDAGLKALNRYVRDLVNITNLGGVGSVLHMGSNVPELRQSHSDACQTFVDNLWWTIENMPNADTAIILLENMAGGGNRMCCEMEEWAEFWNEYFDDDLKTHVKWCIDTAHLYATGEYDISKPSEARRFYREFDSKIGWEYVACFHFNGSKTALGSHRDNHDDVGPTKSGQIMTAGLRELARIATRTNKPLILETPHDTYTLVEQFETILSWFN